MTTTNNRPPLPEICDVAIVGGGPAGLAAATYLKQSGVDSVVVLEREPEAGGIPRHCGHPPFGMREFHRCLTGPRYAAALAGRAEQVGVLIHVNTTVISLHEGGRLLVSSEAGRSEITARRVILCTGVRETPRAPRLVSGGRPLGITTTGALQSMVYLKHAVPFRRPVIVGTELVSFSALLTCRHGGIRPSAMIEANDRITARALCRPLPALLGIPLLLESRIAEILGKDRVSGARVVSRDGREHLIACDGVLFTGQFTPEASLLRLSHLGVDPASGGPVVDQFGRCSDPVYFAAGNLLRPVETAGWCWNEGRRTATIVARSLAGNLPEPEKRVSILLRSPHLRFAVPQLLALPTSEDGAENIQLRFQSTAAGRLSVQCGGETLWSRDLVALPERRVLAPLPPLARFMNSDDAIEIHFTERK